MSGKLVKIVVFVPESHAVIVREALATAGAGRIGAYSACTFSTKGVGRFKPEAGANPTIGAVGKYEEVLEEKIETVCPPELVRSVVAAIKKVHPYEEVALDVFAIEDYQSVE